MGKSQSPADLTLRHLQVELARLDARIAREVRRWTLAGQDPSDAFRGLHLSVEQIDKLLELPPFTSYGQAVSLTKEESAAFAGLENRALRMSEAVTSSARDQGCPTRLDRLTMSFGLDRVDLDAFLVCLAPYLDLRYERLYGFLQDDVTRRLPSVNLVLNLLHGRGAERLRMLARFSGNAPLMRHRLLEWVPGRNGDAESLLNRVLRPDTSVVSWLLDNYEPDPELGQDAHLRVGQTDREDRLVAGEAWVALRQHLDQEPVIALYGPDSAARTAAARLVADALGRSFLDVNLKAAVGDGCSLGRTIQLALRDALFLGAVPVLSGWDAALKDGAPEPVILERICTHPGIVILSSEVSWRARGLARDRSVLWTEFPKPPYRRRQALWRWFATGSEEGEVSGVADLAGQFSLTTEQIRDAVAAARDVSAWRDQPPGIDDLYAGARLHSNPNLAKLAHKVALRYSWPDIILPTDQLSILREIVSTVRERPKVLEAWGIGKKLTASDGITGLFSGPPGTGKTMAAQVIAAELKLDLYKVDLSTVVSKYIGETEKNLERIFSEAEDSNAILFFDEADALFGKRSEVKDAHDRYANIEVSYLLQRMEAYDGVTILATNLRANLDAAFVRRLQFVVDFPFPEEADRVRIWQTLFPKELPRSPDLDFALLARRFKLAGGNIRNVIVAAAFLAAGEGTFVTMRHLLHSTRRELQKMGRLVSQADISLE